MKFWTNLVLLVLLSSVSYAQTTYQIRADSVRIYSGCDTAELIIENRTKDSLGFLFNKGKGRTEFRKLRLKMLPNGSLAIVGQDTLAMGTGYILNQTGPQQAASFNIGGSGQMAALNTGRAGGLSQWSVYNTTNATSANLRWTTSLWNEEGTDNTGSDYWISRYNNSGSIVGSPFKINRNSGVIDMLNGFIAGNGSSIRGTGTGVANQSYLRFMESDGTTQIGYIGKGGKQSNDLVFLSSKGDVKLSAYDSGNPQFTVSSNQAILSTGVLSLSNQLSNNIIYSGVGVGAPTFGTRSAGTKITIYSSLAADQGDYGVGLETGYVWLSVPRNNAANGWKFYGGTTTVAKIDGAGGSEWNAMGRFKGDFTSGSGPATELGFSSGQAQIRGYDRTAGKYTLISLIGGSIANDPKSFSIDGKGYAFSQLPNIKILGTDESGYLKEMGANYIQNIDPYNNQAAQNAGIFTANAIGTSARMVVRSNGSDSIAKGYELRTSNMAAGGALFQLNGDAQPGLSTWIYDGVVWRRRINTNAITGITDFAVTPTVGGSIVLTQTNHVSGSALNPVLTGAKVLSTLTTNASGHVINATTRSLTAADIGAAPATGSVSYIQNQSGGIQNANFNVSGGGFIGGDLAVGGNDAVAGSVTSTGFYQSSLRALKMNIKTCELNAVEIIENLKIREFEYKRDPGKKVIGIIADDEPSIISGDKHDHLDMMNAIGLLLKSVQELNTRLEKLEQEVNKPK